jgi:archaeal type IV pilus assembly protein PilA
MIQHKDAAVSPVVGVMLMLVVTIIIAAVVSAFAGGLGGEQHKTPQATMNVKSVITSLEGSTSAGAPITYSSGYTAANGIQFENTGGDTFSLSDIAIQLQSQDAKYTITSQDKINRTDVSVCFPAGITSNDGYFQKIGNSSTTDQIIAPGDKFMLYADRNTHLTDYGSWGVYPATIGWKPNGAAGGFAAQVYTKIQYQVIDTVSNRPITTGEFILA